MRSIKAASETVDLCMTTRRGTGLRRNRSLPAYCRHMGTAYTVIVGDGHVNAALRFYAEGFQPKELEGSALHGVRGGVENFRQGRSRPVVD